MLRATGNRQVGEQLTLTAPANFCRLNDGSSIVIHQSPYYNERAENIASRDVIDGYTLEVGFEVKR